jgi:hypothetical protein
MVDLLLSNRRSDQCEYMYMLFPCHVMDVGQVCTSSAIAYYVKRQSSRHKIQCVWPTFCLQKSSSATLLFKQVWKQNLIRRWMASKVQNSKWLSSGCFQSVLCRFPCSILCMIFDICAAYKDFLYNTFVPVLIVVFRTKIRNNCNDNFVLRVFWICYLKLVFIFFLCVCFLYAFSHSLISSI